MDMNQLLEDGAKVGVKNGDVEAKRGPGPRIRVVDSDGSARAPKVTQPVAAAVIVTPESVTEPEVSNDDELAEPAPWNDDGRAQQTGDTPPRIEPELNPALPTPAPAQAAADDVVGKPAPELPRGRFKMAVDAVRAPIARRWIERKRRLELNKLDQKNKTASSQRRNPAKFAVALVVAVLACVFLVTKSMQDIAQPVIDAAEKTEHSKAVQAATNLLDGDAGAASSAQNASPVQAKQEGTSLAAEIAKAAQNDTGNLKGNVSQHSSTPAPGEDGYTRKLAMLKGGLAAQSDAKAPSKLPPEIAAVELPGQYKGGKGPPRPFQEAPPKVEASVPDMLEDANVAPGRATDVLSRVSVVGGVRITRSNTSPYLAGPVRMMGTDPAVFIYPRNADPAITGQWYFVGDQTPEGWTVVQISRAGVNVISPDGRVYQLNS